MRAQPACAASLAVMEPLLDVRNLSVQLHARGRSIQAVSDMSYLLLRGEALALVGESGCGKTVSALTVLGLLPTDAAPIVSGSVMFEGQELIGLSEAKLQRIRGSRISMIFQDPQTSLNPVLTIGRQIAEVLETHLAMSRKAADRRAIELLELVGVPDASRRLGDYPHQFSGGMRQRVMIAMALACNPAMIIADEPTTALDVTIQAQVLNVLTRLRTEFDLAVLIITHDLGLVAGFADRVAVMYAGRIVEVGPTEELLSDPTHPYTIGLIGSVPRIDRPRSAALVPIEGSPPDLASRIVGCPFVPRCAWRTYICTIKDPVLEPAGMAGAQADSQVRQTACHNRPTLAEAVAGHPLGAVASRQVDPGRRV